MLYKLLLVLSGLWVIYDRATYFAVESYASGMSPVGESVLFILVGVFLILLGVFTPRQFVRDMF